MTAETARVPGRMAGDATHILVAMSAVDIATGRNVAPNKVVIRSEAHGFRKRGFFVVMFAAWSDRVFDLKNFPRTPILYHRILNCRAAQLLKKSLAKWCTLL